MLEPTKREWIFIWLDAIVQAWSDDDFKKKLLTDPIKALSDRQKKKRGDGSLPIPQWVKLCVKEPPDAEWHPNLHLWPLPYTEISMAFPSMPSKPSQEAVALLAYGEQMSRFDMTHYSSESKSGPTDHSYKKSVDKITPGKSPSLELAGESPLPAIEQQIRWFSIWPQAIVFAWRNDTFMNQLLKETRLALLNAFAFEFPGAVSLRVKDQLPDLTWDEKSMAWTGQYWAQLTMILPPNPPHAEAAIALGAYADSGRGNPFTLPIC